MSKSDTTTNDKLANLIGATDPKIDREARERLITARIGLLLKASFFGNLATRMKLINADQWCSTAATDGRNFYYNSRFIMMLDIKELEFLFGHEVLHVVYDHLARREHRDAILSNIAADYAVNGDLVRHNIGRRITSVDCLYDTKYVGWSFEEIYEDLFKNAKKIDLNDLLNAVLDDHMEDDGNNGGDSKDGQCQGLRPKLTEEEKNRIRDEIKEAVISAAQTCDAGNLPAGVRRIIQDITAPKMNWRELLRMQLESTIKSDYTWAKPSRRSWHMDAVMPGMRNDEMIDIAVFIDMSGSIGEAQGRDFVSEVQGIMEQFQSYKIHVACFDTQVYNHRVYDSDNLEGMSDYELAGGGGTSFECIFDWLKEEQIEPKRLVVFTDGYPCGSWGDANYCDTVWIIHGDKNPNPPFGTWALYEDQTK